MNHSLPGPHRLLTVLAALALCCSVRAEAPSKDYKLVWADEFDYIMEYWARRPHEMTATVHWRKDGQHQQDHGRMEVPESLAGFHVYALEWSAARMDFFCDGKTTASCSSSNAGCPC